MTWGFGAFGLQTGLFFRRKLLETLRQPVWIITGLTIPVLYLALFAPLLRPLAGGPAFPPGHVLDVFVPGIMVLIALGLKLKQIGSLAAVVTGTQLPLTLLAGILLPLSLGPTWLRVLGHINPMYYAVQAARSLAAGTVASGTVGVGFLVTAGIAGLALWWGTRAYQQAMA
jgi:ABC-2 type transport system permease protein